MKEKDALRARFASEPEKYYQVELFVRNGFQRKKCQTCGKFFWTIDDERTTCPEPPCQYYEFLGRPPTRQKLDYVQTWKLIEAYFVRHGHASISRYPVVCRWRPDLYFTVASIIDFQRVEGSKVVFELPANPLIIPQMCLRFNDIPNVGVSGKHYTAFCMIGQHSIASDGGYWKDRCIDLDYGLLTDAFGIDPRRVVFVEDVWLGYGAFGYSLEYHVDGIELGNAVFTEFEGIPSEYRLIPEKVIDMGAGLERFAWLSQGTPTSYDSTFGPATRKMIDACSIEYDQEFFLRYARLAGALNLDEVTDLTAAKKTVAKSLGTPLDALQKKTLPLEAMYAVLDHTRSLVFAVVDGLLPSNVAGGYNLRVILRRALAFVDRLGWEIALDEVAAWHVDFLHPLYPELAEHRDEITKILEVERQRYENTKKRTEQIVAGLLQKREPVSEETLIRLYDSDGITPELLREKGVDITVPPDFYVKVTERHLSEKPEVETPRFDLKETSATGLLFYDNQDMFEFSARVVKVLEDRFIVLDQTAFYPRSGGAEPDLGFINSSQVIDVEKHGDVVLHRVDRVGVRGRQAVTCRVDAHRRGLIMRHHTATHVVNGAAREILGSWIWQHSAFKDVNEARLDITHYAHLTREQVQQIEDRANEIVRRNLSVSKAVMPRGEAEKKYGFRLYQGGVVPGKTVRVVAINGFDVEACGGVHVHRTGDIGFIKLLKSERVQDGVERLSLVAGEPATKYVQTQEAILASIVSTVGVQKEKLVQTIDRLVREPELLRRRQKALMRKFSGAAVAEVTRNAKEVKGLKVYVTKDEILDEEFHISVGEQAITTEPRLVYCSLLKQDTKVRILIFSGSTAQRAGVSAGTLVKSIASIIGGSGGGDAQFAQGGGNHLDKVPEAEKSVFETVKRLVRTQ